MGREKKTFKEKGHQRNLKMTGRTELKTAGIKKNVYLPK